MQQRFRERVPASAAGVMSGMVAERRLPLRRTGLYSVLTMLLAVVGCGDSAPAPVPLYPVTGTLTMDGKPFGPATLRFTRVMEESMEVGKGFTGTADAEGKVTFTTYKVGDGAPSGDFKVTVHSSMGGGSAKPIPGIYQSQSRTPLSVVVAEITGEGANTINVALDSKAGRPNANPATMQGIDPSIAFPGGDN